MHNSRLQVEELLSYIKKKNPVSMFLLDFSSEAQRTWGHSEKQG
jgi:hypothetical protein